MPSGFANPLFALEELEIEKLIQETEDSKESVFDELYKETKDQIKKEEEKTSTEEEPESAKSAAQAQPSSTESPGDRVTGDSEISEPDNSGEDASSDLEEEDTSTLKEVGADEDSNHQISTESLRQFLSMHTSLLLDYPSLEAYDDKPYEQKSTNEYTKQDWNRWGSEAIDQSVGHVGNLLETSGSVMMKSAKWIGRLGIEYLPKMAKGAYKGTSYAFKKIVYGFDRLAHGLIVGLTALEQYIIRRTQSFNHLLSEIKNAKKLIDLLKSTEVEDIEDKFFEDEKTIHQMVIGDSIDLLQHLDVLSKFIENTIKGIGISIKEDMKVIEQFIAYSSFRDTDSVLKMLEIHPKIDHLQSGDVEGFHSNSNLTHSYHVGAILPGNATLICHLPSVDNKDRKEWVQAYKESEIFIGIDRKSFKMVEKIPYDDLSKLSDIADKLESLCQICIKHQAFYEDMKKVKIHLKTVYKSYFNSVVKNGEKPGVKESLVDLVILKNTFIDKVYMAAAIDIHDYSVRVINSYLRFLSKNLSTLKKS